MQRFIGPYEVVRELGRGGMGVVYEARHPSIPRPLALKLIAVGGGRPMATARFEREARLLAKVRHANVVAIHAAGTAQEGLYLVTDLVVGQGLDALTATARGGRPLEPRRAAALVRALADGVAAVHAEGVIHRDLKPGNVIVREDGAPVLLDFGLARDEGAERLTATGAVMGTPAFMAPEQANAEPGGLDARTDVYGLGAVLFAVLTGRPPFEADTTLGIIVKLLKEEVAWPAELEQAAPELVAIGRVATAKDRADRYEGAAGLRDDLDRLLRGEAPWAVDRGETLRARAEAARRAARRRRRLVALGAAAPLLALLAGAGAWAVDRRRARRALEDAAAFHAATLEPWGLGLGEGAPPSSAAALELEARLAALDRALPRLPAADAEAARDVAGRLRAARHRLAGTAPEPDGSLGAHEQVALGLAHLERDEVLAAWAAAERALELAPASAVVRSFHGLAEAARDPRGVLRRAKEDRSPGEVRPLQAALERLYLQALPLALRGEPALHDDTVKRAGELGLDLGRLAPHKAAALDAPGLPGALRVDLARPLVAGRSQALEALAHVQEEQPRVPLPPALAQEVRGWLERLARDSLRELDFDRPLAERLAVLQALLHAESACAVRLGLDTRLDAVAHAVRVGRSRAQVRGTPLEVPMTLCSYRLGIVPRLPFGGETRLIEALGASVDPLAPLVKLLIERAPATQLEPFVHELPDHLLAPRLRGQLALVVGDALLEAPPAPPDPARVARVRALAQLAWRLCAHPVDRAQAAMLEADACGVVDPRLAAQVSAGGARALAVGPDADDESREGYAWALSTHGLDLLELPAGEGAAAGEDALRRAYELAPPGAVRRIVRARLARGLRTAGRTAQARAVLGEELAEEDRDCVDLWIEHALLAHDEDDTTRAIHTLTRARAHLRGRPADERRLTRAGRSLKERLTGPPR